MTADEIRQLADRAGIDAGTSVLDVCCGTGQLTHRVSQLAFQVSGIDASGGMLAYARKNAPEAIQVTNVMTAEAIGYIGNLSVDGMLLIADHAMTDDALFQFNFELPESDPPRRIEIGVHEQWGEPANTPGQYWAGFRIIDIAPDDRTALVAWVETHEG